MSWGCLVCAVVPQRGGEVREQGRGRDSAPVFILKLTHSMSSHQWSDSVTKSLFFLGGVGGGVKEDGKEG